MATATACVREWISPCHNDDINMPPGYMRASSSERDLPHQCLIGHILSRYFFVCGSQIKLPSKSSNAGIKRCIDAPTALWPPELNTIAAQKQQSKELTISAWNAWRRSQAYFTLAPLGKTLTSHLWRCGWLPLVPHSLPDTGPTDHRTCVCELVHSPLSPSQGHPCPRPVARFTRYIT